MDFDMEAEMAMFDEEEQAAVPVVKPIDFSKYRRRKEEEEASTRPATPKVSELNDVVEDASQRISQDIQTTSSSPTSPGTNDTPPDIPKDVQQIVQSRSETPLPDHIETTSPITQQTPVSNSPSRSEKRMSPGTGVAVQGTIPVTQEVAQEIYQEVMQRDSTLPSQFVMSPNITDFLANRLPATPQDTPRRSLTPTAPAVLVQVQEELPMTPAMTPAPSLYEDVTVATCSKHPAVLNIQRKDSLAPPKNNSAPSDLTKPSTITENFARVIGSLPWATMVTAMSNSQKLAAQRHVLHTLCQYHSGLKPGASDIPKIVRAQFDAWLNEFRGNETIRNSMISWLVEQVTAMGNIGVENADSDSRSFEDFVEGLQTLDDAKHELRQSQQRFTHTNDALKFAVGSAIAKAAALETESLSFKARLDEVINERNAVKIERDNLKAQRDAHEARIEALQAQLFQVQLGGQHNNQQNFTPPLTPSNPYSAFGNQFQAAQPIPHPNPQAGQNYPAFGAQYNASQGYVSQTNQTLQQRAAAQQNAALGQQTYRSPYDPQQQGAVGAQFNVAHSPSQPSSSFNMQQGVPGGQPTYASENSRPRSSSSQQAFPNSQHMPAQGAHRPSSSSSQQNYANSQYTPQNLPNQGPPPSHQRSHSKIPAALGQLGIKTFEFRPDSPSSKKRKLSDPTYTAKPPGARYWICSRTTREGPVCGIKNDDWLRGDPGNIRSKCISCRNHNDEGQKQWINEQDTIAQFGVVPEFEEFDFDRVDWGEEEFDQAMASQFQYEQERERAKEKAAVKAPEIKKKPEKVFVQNPMIRTAKMGSLTLPTLPS